MGYIIYIIGQITKYIGGFHQATFDRFWPSVTLRHL